MLYSQNHCSCIIFLVQVTSCKHAFCKACLIDYSASLGNASCPTCLKPLTVDLTTRNSGEKPSVPAIKGFKRSGILSRLNNITDFKTSTKIDALVRYFFLQPTFLLIFYCLFCVSPMVVNACTF